MREITGRLAQKAASPAYLALQREDARKTVTEFVEKWLVTQESWKSARQPEIRGGVFGVTGGPTMNAQVKRAGSDESLSHAGSCRLATRGRHYAACGGGGVDGRAGRELFDLTGNEQSRRAVTISTVIFGLILLALCGMCWQAGYRLAFDRPDRSGTLFSRPAWLAIGTGLVVITALMAGAIFTARRPTLLDVQVLLFLGGIGVWCVVLALRRSSAGHGG